MIELLIGLVMWLVSIAISWLMIEIHVCLSRWSSGHGLHYDDENFLRLSSIILGPAFVIYWLYVIFYSFLWNVLKIRFLSKYRKMSMQENVNKMMDILTAKGKNQ